MLIFGLIVAVLVVLALIDRPRRRPSRRKESLIQRVMRGDL